MGTSSEYSSFYADKDTDNSDRTIAGSETRQTHPDDRPTLSKAASVSAKPWQTLRNYRARRGYGRVKWSSQPEGSQYSELSAISKLVTGRRVVAIGFHPKSSGPLLFTTSTPGTNDESITATRYLDRATRGTLNRWLTAPNSAFAHAVRAEGSIDASETPALAVSASSHVRKLRDRQTVGGPDIVYLEPADVLTLDSLIAKHGGSIKSDTGSVILRAHLNSIQQDYQHTIWPPLTKSSKAVSAEAPSWPGKDL